MLSWLNLQRKSLAALVLEAARSENVDLAVTTKANLSRKHSFEFALS